MAKLTRNFTSITSIFFALFVTGVTHRFGFSQATVESIVSQYKQERLLTGSQRDRAGLALLLSDGANVPHEKVVEEIKKVTAQQVPIRWRSRMENSHAEVVTYLPFHSERPLLLSKRNEKLIAYVDSGWMDLGIQIDRAVFLKDEYYATELDGKRIGVVQIGRSSGRVILSVFGKDGGKIWEQKIPFDYSVGQGTGGPQEYEISLLSSAQAVCFFGAVGNEFVFCQINAKDGVLMKWWGNKFLKD